MTRRLLAILCVLQATACSYALVPPRLQDGRPFNASKLAQLTKGMSSDDVRALLGEPYEVKTEGDTARWRYYARHLEEERVKFLGFVPLPSRKDESVSEATIEFKGGRVDGFRVSPRTGN
jgi:outer membrane protein assembly factor BamE (lipoprotein component of BamABCDE complex)